MKLILNNLVYESTNVVKIAKLKELGAVEVAEEKKEKKLTDMKVEELKEIAKEKGLVDIDNLKKAELIKLLNEVPVEEPEDE